MKVTRIIISVVMYAILFLTPASAVSTKPENSGLTIVSGTLNIIIYISLVAILAVIVYIAIRMCHRRR